MSIINKIRKNRKILYPIFYLVLFIIISANIVTQSTKEFINKKKEREAKEEGFEDNIPEEMKKNRINFIKNWNLEKTSVVDRLGESYKEIDEKKKGDVAGEIEDDDKEEKINTKFIDGNSKGSMISVNNAEGKAINYIIPSSYNSCVGGKYNKGYVDKEILRMVLYCGARMVDFEIYSIDGKPVISCSQNLEFNNKSSINVLPLGEALDVVVEKMKGENNAGPMFINLRVHTANLDIYRKIGELIEFKFKANNLLYPPTEKFIDTRSTDSMNAHFREVPINKLSGKAIITASNPVNNFFDIIRGTPLGEDDIGQFYNNIHLMGLIRQNELDGNTLTNIKRYTEISPYQCSETIKAKNIKDCYNHSRGKFHMILPDIGFSTENFDWKIPEEHGYQFIFMKWQTVDKNMVSYYNMFVNSETMYMKKNANKLLRTVLTEENEEVNKVLKNPPQPVSIDTSMRLD